MTLIPSITILLKYRSASLAAEKADYILEESFNLLIVVRFFSLPIWILGENKAKLKKPFNLNSRLRWGT